MPWPIAPLVLLAALPRPAPAARAADAVALLEVLVDDDAMAAAGEAEREVEQRERAIAAGRILDDLEGVLPDPQLDLARQLRMTVDSGAPVEQRASLARRLQHVVERRFGVVDEPRRPPDLARGAAEYARSCSACHGTDGWAPSQERLRLSPPPTAFADPLAAGRFTPRHVLRIVNAGVPETAMPSYAEGLDEDARWDVAFFIVTLAHGAGDFAALGRARAAGFRSGYRQLAAASDDFLRLQLQAAGLSAAEAEGALAAVRAGPFDDGREGPPALVIPRGPVPLEILWQQSEDEAGTPVERVALALSAPLPAGSNRSLLAATRNVGLQMLCRRGRPPFDLNLTVFESAAAARAGRGAVASCNLVSDEEIECDVRE